MIARFIRKLLSSWCTHHERAFDSDFCPECVRARIVRAEVVDERPEWTVADQTWRRRETEANGKEDNLVN